MPVWVQLFLGVVAAVSTLAAAALGWFGGKNKTRADVAQTIHNMALAQLLQMEQHLGRLTAQVEDYRARLDGMERRERDKVTASQPHAEWDWQVVRALTAAGQPVPPMPPIFSLAGAHRDTGERTRAGDRGA